MDIGAGACFVSRRWVKQHGVTRLKTNPVKLTLADGAEFTELTDAIDIPIRHSSHTVTTLRFVTEIGWQIRRYLMHALVIVS
jgi:hypothetical protein